MKGTAITWATMLAALGSLAVAGYRNPRLIHTL